MADQDGAEIRVAYDKGWNDARRDCWAPVQTRWRDVRLGDVTVDRKGNPWMVTRTLPVLAVCNGTRTAEAKVDLDDHVMVLTPMPIADARQALKAGGVSITPLSEAEGES